MRTKWENDVGLMRTIATAGIMTGFLAWPALGASPAPRTVPSHDAGWNRSGAPLAGNHHAQGRFTGHRGAPIGSTSVTGGAVTFAPAAGPRFIPVPDPLAPYARQKYFTQRGDFRNRKLGHGGLGYFATYGVPLTSTGYFVGAEPCEWMLDRFERSGLPSWRARYHKCIAHSAG
jgi:hypothetical protein